jgi:hypothetical protein
LTRVFKELDKSIVFITMNKINIVWNTYGQEGLVGGTEERVRAVEGYEGYFITDHGRVLTAFNGVGSGSHINYDCIKEKVQQWRGEDGYKYWSLYLCKDGNRKFFYVHRLVALAFIPNPNNLPIVDHLHYPSNYYKDLEWVTQKENVRRGKIGQGLTRTTIVPLISEKKTPTSKHQPGRRSLTYTIEDPNGNRIIVSSLNKFCKENGLCSGNLYRGGRSKGYRVVTRGE